MNPEQFIAKWQANTRNERAACQEHFIDLCALLGEPTPNTDPTGEAYAFEKGATKATGGEGWADVWRRGCFAWEYKGKHRDLEAAYRQLLLYAGALQNPPLLVVSDIERIIIRANWTNAVSERRDIRLPELGDPAKRHLLKLAFSDPGQLRPARTREGLTQEAAGEFAELAKRLRERGNGAETVAHFVNRLVFCLFADDVGLLPAGLFERMLTAARKNPARFTEYASRLFAAMAERGGEVDFTPVQWFNGGLFDDAAALPLQRPDLDLVARVAALDWAEIDPSILGTLFERGLDPDKRSQLGAHYTDRAKIEKLIDPVIRRPLAEEWREQRGRIEAVLAQPNGSRGRRARDPREEAQRLYHAFLDRLRNFRVLDPACGSGNFLYLALLALKDLEHQASVEAEALGLQREFPRIGPETVLGIEINPYAAELARVSVWIGHIQWARRHGLPPPADPVLRPLDTIECRDAVLSEDGKPAQWPKADAIVGNPPFLGDKAMIGVLGYDYTIALRQAYAGRVPGAADLVCFWFENAREAIARGTCQLAGLVGTQSIRKGASRIVLDRIRETAPIYNAWDDEPWTVEGAAVRVSLVCFAGAGANLPKHLDGQPVSDIFADLTAGDLDLTVAKRLAENGGLSFQGPVKVGAFDVDGETARRWVTGPLNANGRPNSDVVRPWINGRDITGRPSDKWIIDFADRTERESAFFAQPFAHVAMHVKPKRDKNRDGQRRQRWWQLGRSGADLRSSIAPLTRFISTPRVAKHRVFVWSPPSTLPDSRIYAVACDDDATFGILHSRFHEVWSLAMGSRHGDGSAGGRPTYNNAVCFETFPFPDGLTPNLPASSYESDPHAQTIAQAARDLVVARERWLNPPDLVERVPEVVPGFPDRIVPRNARAAAILKKRTLTNLYNARGKPEGAWLDNLHRALDEAVAAAYGWPADLPDDEGPTRLLALNQARARVDPSARARGRKRAYPAPVAEPAG